MDTGSSWGLIKTHRERFSPAEIQGLARVLFQGREAWLQEKMHRGEDQSLCLEFLGRLGEMGSKAAAEILLAQLESANEALQIAAAEALKNCSPPLIKERLIVLMRGHYPCSVKAGEILLSLGQEGADILWKLWFESNTSVKLKAQILNLFAEADEERAEALAFLAFLSGNEELIRAALNVSERQEAKSLWGNIAICLNDYGWQIRGKAAKILGLWREKQALPFLFQMERDTDPWVEDERRTALSLISDHAASRGARNN